jgi:aspartate/methionine/tyrosine aminotransferase
MLPDFRLETYFSRWEFNARFNLCASDMESMSVRELHGLTGDDSPGSLDELHLGYTETFGAPELRAAIATTYDNIGDENVLTFAGAEEGIFVAMQVLLSACDHAIVVTPNYQAAETVPNSICEVTGVALEANNNWNLDLAKVESALRTNTKLISINFPHNPTGKVINPDVLEDLISLARDRNIYLFSDEVYRLLERDETRRLPQVADRYERGLSLNVMSKAYGLPGLRIGWISTRDSALLKRMEHAKHYLSICNSGPSEVLAVIALRARELILSRNRAIIQENLKLLDDFFADFPDLFEWTVPDGGCIGFPRYLGEDGVEPFCQALVEEAGVLLLPASIYRSDLTPTPGDRFRIGYGRSNMAEALMALRQFISNR